MDLKIYFKKKIKILLSARPEATNRGDYIYSTKNFLYVTCPSIVAFMTYMPY